MTSGAVAAISFGCLLAAAVPILAAISNAPAGLLSIFFPTCFGSCFAQVFEEVTQSFPCNSLIRYN